MNYSGLIAELGANMTIPDDQLTAIMTSYPSCWGFAAPVTDKAGAHKLLMNATKIPEGWAAKDIQDMKAQFNGTPEMVEYFGKFPDNVDEVCLQPFPCLEDDKGNLKLCVFLEGDFDHWGSEEEPNLTPEYLCYREKILPLVNKLNNMNGGDVHKVIEELGSDVFKDVLEGTFEKRGVIQFLADYGGSQLIEGENNERHNEDWGSTSNEVPDLPKDLFSFEPTKEPVKELTLAEKRKIRMEAEAAAKGKDNGVRATTASPKSLTQVTPPPAKEAALSSTIASHAKGPFLFTLPANIKTVGEALEWWKAQAGTCPDMWKHKDPDNAQKWVPSYTAGFPYEKFSKGSIIHEKFNKDGTPKSSGKGFAAIDDIATNKGPVATAVGPQPDATRPPAAPSKFPIIPVAVRDKVLAKLDQYDLKSRKIMSNEDMAAAEKRHSSFSAQLKNMPRELLWLLEYAELDYLNRTYPDFGSAYIFALRNFEILNYKKPEEPKKKETGEYPDKQPEPPKELTLAEKRALRKAAAA